MSVKEENYKYNNNKQINITLKYLKNTENGICISLHILIYTSNMFTKIKKKYLC